MTIEYDPRDPATLRDPYAIFAELRARGGVAWCPALSGWLALDWAGVNTVVMTPQVFSANRLGEINAHLPEPDRTTAGEVLDWLTQWIVFQDPPNHTRVRRHLSSAINPKMVHRMRAATASITTDLLDELGTGETFDFYTEIGLRLPGYVVMDLLGVPRTRLGEVKAWSDQMMMFIGSARGVPDKYAQARQGAQSMAGLFRELIEQRRLDPQPDVVTHLLGNVVGADRLSDDEIVAAMMMIANGAQETTAHLLSNSLIALTEHPEAHAKLAGDPDALMPTAVEEFLRYDSPVLSTARLVVTDTELGGATLSPGDRIFAMLAAANRDPAVFTNPDTLTVEGHPAAHFAFSKGAHFCLGAPVARMEVQIALTEILRRFPNWRITEPRSQIPWTNSMVARGPVRLPVALA
ncbi:MAG: cytochrome P450 [Sporichthyaceae bacterium]